MSDSWTEESKEAAAERKIRRIQEVYTTAFEGRCFRLKTLEFQIRSH